MIFRTKKTKDRKGKVLIVNALNEVVRKNSQSFLEDNNITKIVKTYDGFRDVENFSKVVTLEELEENDFSLSIPLYVHITSSDPIDYKTIKERYDIWSESSKIMKQSFDKVNKIINEEAKNEKI